MTDDDIAALKGLEAWKWMREDKFPRSLNVNGRVRWLEHEIDSWIANRLKGDPDPAPEHPQAVNAESQTGEAGDD